MPINQLNHAVLYVRDAERSAAFYEDALGFTRVMSFPGAVFLQAAGSTNDHDLAVMSVGDGASPSPAGKGSVGLYHLAWEVDTLDDLERFRADLAERGALVGASDHGTTKSLYVHDPDGIELELVWLIPADQLDASRDEAQPSGHLDLAKEIARFGRTTKGGVGISSPAP